jgi:VCBS repeat-containing protein
MSSSITGGAVRSERLRISVFCAVVIALLTQSGLSATGATPLSFFKNYFVTGDYVVGGASLWRKGVNGIATATIPVSGVPATADVLAAFLYVQTAEKTQWSGIDHARFNGADLGTGSASLAKALNWESATPPCWSVAWPGGRRLVTYRADVLRFLPVDTNGKFAVNRAHSIQVPDWGSTYGDDDETSTEKATWNGARAIGASLVIVYRDSSKPLNAIVIYDGGFTKSALGTMNQPIAGFYQASSVAPVAKMTHIVGDGRPFLSETLSLDGQTIAVNPFASTNGPKWDTPTFSLNGKLAGDAASATVRVEPQGWLPDCLSWSAIVFSTTVQDTDNDGLLDVWETHSGLVDPNGQPLPNLSAMGANPFARDLFVEVGFMTSAATTYGGVSKPEHSHVPSQDALRMVAAAFKDAPLLNPDSSTGINVHFDVGNNYQSPLESHIVPANLARGGESIDEQITVCSRGAADPPWVCQFSAYPGTVGWKTGFKFLRDELVDPLQTEDNCEIAGSPNCDRRFDRNRKDMFRYALFAHAIGLPKEPCLEADGSADAACQQSNADFHVPRTNSGVADFPGGDVVVSLGGFDDAAGNPIGTSFMQASTLMHELGHTFLLTHAGPPQLPREPNCKPNYQSVMNYLFQLRGLLTDDNVTHADFSREVLGPVDENFLVDGALGLGLRYRTGWYAPKAGSYLQDVGTAAAKHCDGSPILPTDVPMVRVDSTSVAGSVDWNADGTVNSAPSQDINFDGIKTSLNAGANDWANIRLTELGGRRNVGGLFVNPVTGALTVGPLSLDIGRGDIGRGDIGRGDIGRGDIGRGDIGRGDIGRGDIGRGDIGRGDIGRGDIGSGDLFEPDGELDAETAGLLGNTPPNEVRGCVIGVGTCTSGALHRVSLDWKSPTVGSVSTYRVFRVDGATVATGEPKTLVAQVPAAPGVAGYVAVDPQELANGAFTYFVVAQFVDGTSSAASNFATVAAVNDAPVANDDSYKTNQNTTLSVNTAGALGKGVLANDTDSDSTHLTAKLVTGPLHGTLTLSTDGSFVYQPVAGYSGSDGFTYAADDGDAGRTSNVATVSITVVQVGYELLNVKNLPPAAGVTFKSSSRGTLVDFEWKFTKGGVVVNSADAQPAVTIVSPSGSSRTYTPTACDDFQFVYRSLENKWDFDWNPKSPAPGTYYVIVKSGKTGQRFPASGAGFPVVVTKY